MNFGGGNNPPWAQQSRGGSGGGGGGSHGYGGYNANFAPQQNIGQPGLAMPTSLSAGSAGGGYPSRTSSQQNSGSSSSTASSVNQRVFTGVITKVSDNFGFVDEDVFFQTSVCKGGIPKLGDRVLVEATFNANMPFKWNASRIQLIPNQQPVAPQQQQVLQQQVTAVQKQMSALQQAQLSASTYNPILNTGALGAFGGLAAQQAQQQQASRSFQSVPPPTPQISKPAPRSDVGSGNRASRFDQRDRRDERRDRPRSPLPPRKRSRSPISRRRTRSPKQKSRSRSPKRKQRAVPRYSVTISPLSLDTKVCSVLDVKNRYSNMYIPSDFYHLSLDWSTAFPLYRPFVLGNGTKFAICHKDMAPIEPFPEEVDPSDCDYTYSAKVMLLSQPSMIEIYKKCCSLAEDNKDEDFTHPTRVLQFLVGMRAKNEPLAIGGPWSPSLDGPDPANNPQTLIKTAIRTTKALTGIDLSACTQWYRFVDISYLRAEEVHKGKTIPEHTEHVVMFLPDVWSVVPAMMDYLALQASYKRSLLLRVDNRESEMKKPFEKPLPPPVETPAAAAEKSPEKPAADEKKVETTPTAAADSQSQDVKDTSMETSQESGADTTLDEDEILEKKEPTHWSELDPKTMKVVELRQELEARNLPCKGLKSQLQAKLSKVLKTEMEADEEKEAEKEAEAKAKEEESEPPKPEDTTTAENTEATDNKEEDKDESTEKDDDKSAAAPAAAPVQEELSPEKLKIEMEKIEREITRFKSQLERSYVFPDEPCVLVHPNRAAKNGKFDCSLMSLSVLLDYRPEDNKEHSFEVSLFAESFNEMLMRDFGFAIYKKLCAIPDKKEEPKKEKTAADSKDEKTGKGDDKKEDDKDSKEGDSKETSEEKKGDKSDGPPNKKRKEEDEDDKVSIASSSATSKHDDKKKGAKEERRKWLTVDKPALLAFVYYDTTHTGYIEDKDLEDMFHTLGMRSSRAQVRAIVQKHCARETLHYRKFTDKPEQNAEIALAKEKELNIVELARGNRGEEGTPGGEVTGSVEESGVVMYNGAVLELDKVMSKLDKSESSRLEVEQQMRSLQEETDSVKGKLERSDEKVKRLTTDLKKTSDKLLSTKSERNKREDEVSGLKDILHTASRELHKVVKLVDSTMKSSEEKEGRSSSGAERYTPSREASTSSSSTNKGASSATVTNGVEKEVVSAAAGDSAAADVAKVVEKEDVKTEQVKDEAMETK